LVVDAWCELAGPTDEEYERACWEQVAYDLERFRTGDGPAAARVARLVGGLAGRADYQHDVQRVEMAVVYPIAVLAAKTTDDRPL
jgi:hypothetical protein